VTFVAVVDGPRKLRLRYPAVCSGCGMKLVPGTEAIWDRESKTACCVACTGEPVRLQNPNELAGGSARAKASALESRAVRQARAKWGDDAAAVAQKIVHDDPDVRAWEKGGDGESRLAALITRELGDRVLALHDRLIPGTRASNIDHLFVAPTGIWIVDAKNYTGAIEKRERGPIWARESELYVKRRNRTQLAAHMSLQIKAVKAALELHPEFGAVHVFAALCFIDADWPLFAGPFVVHDVNVVYPSALRDYLKQRGDVSRDTMERVLHALSKALPPARP
jgi:hypothetical protein